MKSLYWSYNQEVDGAYIIRVKGHEKSESLAARCAASCERVQMPHQLWDAYDGTGKQLITPPHHGGFMELVKLTNHYLTLGEVACALGHISLWNRCVQLDRPLVVLEHDAIMLKRFETHPAFNSIIYLGGVEQVKRGWPVLVTPPHATDGPNVHVICRAHAYSIDPQAAKNALAYVLQRGIDTALDFFLRADIFSILQVGLYAYDDFDGTTIENRREKGGRIS